MAGNKKIIVSLTGEGLTTEQVVALGQPDSRIELGSTAMAKVAKARSPIEELIADADTSGKAVYGLTTGFGKLANVNIPQEDRAKLQENIITSHAAGTGPSLPNDQARSMVALRINTLLRANSGIKPETLQRMADIFNAGITPEVPSLGSVGASGDLAPLAHIALGYMLGQGNLYNPNSRRYEPADRVLSEHGFEPNYTLAPKEGLALINGTQYISSLGSYAVEHATKLMYASASAIALSLVAFKGHRAAFDPMVAEVRPQPGQAELATVVRNLTAPAIVETTVHPQDPYSFRTSAVVHGVGLRYLDIVRNTLNIEINSSTDNPLVERAEQAVDGKGRFVSAGDFHGQPVATALDILTIAVLKPIADITTSRIQRITDGSETRGIPVLLVASPGLNSGFMAHEIAAVASSATPVIAPSAHSFPTGQGQEDHVSMGPAAARQALQMTDRLEHLVALELMAATQAIRLRQKAGEDVIIPKLLEPLLSAIDKAFPHLETDRYFKPDVDRVRTLVKEGDIFEKAYKASIRNTEFNRDVHGKGQGLLLF